MRSLVFSDVHANLAALEAVLEHAGAWDEVIFLGDAVVGGPQPEQVVSAMAELDGLFLMGNHDWDVLYKEYSPDEPNPDRFWIHWTQQQLSSSSRAFLAAFRESCAIERDGLRVRLHHGQLPDELGRRLWPDSPPKAFDYFTAQYPEPAILSGHSHVQCRVEHGGRVFINPGSAGQPRLMQPLALYAILEDGELSLEAAPYDTERTARAMERVPLDEDFIEAWQQGYRIGALPDRYPLRDWEPLRRMGYR